VSGPGELGGGEQAGRLARPVVRPLLAETEVRSCCWPQWSLTRIRNAACSCLAMDAAAYPAPHSARGSVKDHYVRL
jgi:hypothetical protein